MGDINNPDELTAVVVPVITIVDESYQSIPRGDLRRIENYFGPNITAVDNAAGIFGNRSQHGRATKKGTFEFMFSYGEGRVVKYSIMNASDAIRRDAPDLSGAVKAEVCVYAPVLLTEQAHRFLAAILNPMQGNDYEPSADGRHLLEVNGDGFTISYTHNGVTKTGSDALAMLEFKVIEAARRTRDGYEKVQNLTS